MPDSKITALASIGTGTDPVNDALVIVDVSDVSPGGMSATGTTKRVSLNNLLASSPTATLASATITGDLTVDTSTLKVNSSSNTVAVGTASSILNGVLSVAQQVASGVGSTTLTLDHYNANNKFIQFGWYGASIGSIGQNAGTFLEIDSPIIGFKISGTEAMRLNATGLGVGKTPLARLDVASARAASVIGGIVGTTGTGSVNDEVQFLIKNVNTASGQNNGAGIGGLLEASASNKSSLLFYVDNGTAVTNVGRFDSNGNLGIGITPSAYGTGIKGLDIGSWAAVAQIGGSSFLGFNVYASTTSQFNYKNTGAIACGYQQGTSGHQWLNAPSNAGAAGANATFTTAMTLTAGGDLLVGSALPVSGGRISGNSSTGPAGRFFSSAGDNQFAAMFDKSSATNTTSQFLIGFTINNQATGSGQINANGASQAAFGTFSDSRLKENIVSLPSQLANILSLRPVEFDYKDGSGHQIGFVAQEMQEVYPDAVGEQNGFLTVTGWSKTEARLVSAIKELAAKVQALEAKLA